MKIEKLREIASATDKGWTASYADGLSDTDVIFHRMCLAHIDALLDVIAAINVEDLDPVFSSTENIIAALIKLEDIK